MSSGLNNTSQLLTRKKPTKNSLNLAFLLVIVLIGLGVWWQRQAISDWGRLLGYHPAAAVAQLATETTMNDSTRHLFYVYHPSLDDKTSFAEHCRAGEQTIVLGCYVSGQGIYIDNIDDPRLNGVLEVTAAHELLHAAYDRLSSKDKDNVNQLVKQAYANVTDKRLHQTIANYQKQGADINDELHSILGTEVRKLPEALEAYYKRYFSNRLAIVAFSEHYEQAFSDRQTTVANYDRQITQLKQQIEDLERSLSSQKQSLDAKRAQLNQYLAAKNYKAYNAQVPGFNSDVNSYNATVVEIRDLIDQYNALVKKRNAIAIEENQLIQAIDSRPTTLQKQ